MSLSRPNNPRYLIRKTLGEGSFGKVFVATLLERAADNTAAGVERPVAYKLHRIETEDDRESYNRELEILRAVAGCPHTLKLIDATHPDEDQTQPYIITELCNGGALIDLMEQGCSPDSEIAICNTGLILLVVRDTALALECMHNAGYVHLDVKPDNIFVSLDLPPNSPEARAAKEADWAALYNRSAADELTGSPTLKRLIPKMKFVLGDYGGVERCGGSGSAISTLEYTPPESQRFDRTFEPSWDIWALGVTMYMMMYGDLPYAPDAVKRYGIRTLIRSGKIYWPEPTRRGLSSDAPIPGQLELLRRMLDYDPQKRPTAREVVDTIHTIALDECAHRARRR